MSGATETGAEKGATRGHVGDFQRAGRRAYGFKQARIVDSKDSRCSRGSRVEDNHITSRTNINYSQQYTSQFGNSKTGPRANVDPEAGPMETTARDGKCSSVGTVVEEIDWSLP